MKARFTKSRPSLRYVYSGVQYSYILFLLTSICITPFATLQDTAPLLKIHVPDSVNSAVKLTHEEKTIHDYPRIFVGKSLDPFICFPSSKSQIQVNDMLITSEQIPLYLSDFGFSCPPVKKIAYLKIDSYTKMDVVYSIREKIREAGFYRICYVVN
jgi:hypothetical protein